MRELTQDERCLAALYEALEQLRAAKPGNRSERDRRYAVSITELEKVIGYFNTFVVEANQDSGKQET